MSRARAPLAPAADLPLLELSPGPRESWRGRPGRSPGRRAWAALWLIAVVGALVLGGVGRSEAINADGLPQLGDFFSAALHPRLDAGFLDLTWHAALTTLSYAVLGSALSLIIGLLAGAALSGSLWRGARSGSRQAHRPAGRLVGRGLLVVPRAIHEVVWGLFFLSVLGLDPMVAVLAIGIPYGAMSAKVFAEILDDAPRAPAATLRAAGAARATSLLYGVLPAALPDLVSYSFYRFECAIRGAAILGLVGAGGLGFQLALSFQALRYEEMWTFIYALVILSGAVDLWSARVRARALAGGRPPAAGGPPRPRRDRLLWGSLLALAVLVPICAVHVGLDASVLWSRRARELFGDAVQSAWPPDLGSGELAEIARASLDTAAMSVLAIAFAFVGAAALAFPAAAGSRLRRGEGRGARTGAVRMAAASIRLLLLFLRAVPPPVGAFLLLLVLFPGVLPGALALGLYNLGILGRLMAESVENLDDTAAGAIRASGAGSPQSLLYGTLPAVFPRFMAYGLYRWEVAIRETVVVGVVGAGGLGVLLQERISAFDYAGLVTVLLALIVLTLAVDVLSAAMRRAFA